MAKYECVRKCWFKGKMETPRLFEVGDAYTGAKGEDVPRHFKKIGGDIEPEATVEVAKEKVEKKTPKPASKPKKNSRKPRG